MPDADFNSGPNSAHSSPAGFANTHWSVVLSAADPHSPEAAGALETLCQAYWLPLYSFIRRNGESPHDAQDLTQAFFAKLIEKDFLRSVRRERGRFRSFLLAALKHFLSNERDRARAKKRGGGQGFIPIDLGNAETRYGYEPVEDLTPRKIFERRWAGALLERALSGLRRQYTSQGKAALFDALKSTLTESRGSTPYAQLGAQLGLSEAAVKMAVHRLRQGYRDQLRAEVAQTVSRPDEVEDELREVLRVFND